jgi:hypothetical protein
MAGSRLFPRALARSKFRRGEVVRLQEAGEEQEALLYALGQISSELVKLGRRNRNAEAALRTQVIDQALDLADEIANAGHSALTRGGAK